LSWTSLKAIVKLFILYHYDSIWFCDTSALLLPTLLHFAQYFTVKEHPFPNLPHSLWSFICGTHSPCITGSLPQQHYAGNGDLKCCWPAYGGQIVISPAWTIVTYYFLSFLFILKKLFGIENIFLFVINFCFSTRSRTSIYLLLINNIQDFLFIHGNLSQLIKVQSEHPHLVP
jgi:hypothetical protein